MTARRPVHTVLLGGVFLAGVVATLAILAGPVLFIDREPRVTPDDLKPLLKNIELFTGLPGLPDGPTSVVLLLRHPDGADVAVKLLRRNAHAAGWRDFPGGVFSPEGICASVETLERFLESADLQAAQREVRRVLTDDIERSTTAVLVAVPRC